MIKLDNVSKRYKNLKIFDNVNLIIPENKKILIKGINGSGKSVFLKLLTGFSKPDSGEIFIDDYKLNEKNEFIKDAGVMINAPEFMADRTGIDNLLFLANINKKINKDEIMELVVKFGMEENINKLYKTYSLGMKQKLRIIQALMERPKYLILDEPFDALDKKSRELVNSILNDFIKGNHCTLIYTSHSSEAEDFADLIYEINDYNLEIVK